MSLGNQPHLHTPIYTTLTVTIIGQVLPWTQYRHLITVSETEHSLLSHFRDGADATRRGLLSKVTHTAELECRTPDSRHSNGEAGVQHCADQIVSIPLPDLPSRAPGPPSAPPLEQESEMSS